MPDYQKGKIYKIECNITGEVYIGSTCESTVARRLTTHVDSYKQWKKDKLNKAKTYSFDIIDRNDYQIYLIENYPCNNKDELRAREGHIMKQYKLDSNCINFNIPKRTRKEYYEDNKDKIKNKQKEWYENNKNRILENHKEQYCENKKSILNRNKQYREDNKEKIATQHKQYVSNNKEKITTYQKQYREDNKERISDLKKTQIKCECGLYYTLSNKARHEKTKKHIELINTD